jgi:hypothetical protein
MSISRIVILVPTVGLLSIAVLTRSSWIGAQESFTLPPVPQQPSPPTTGPTGGDAIRSDATPGPQPTVDPKSDPLFHEIQRMLLEGKSFSLGTSSSPVLAPTTRSELPTAPIPPSSRWKAVESMLTAARLLEAESAIELQRNSPDTAKKLNETVEMLRRQALALLQIR